MTGHSILYLGRGEFAAEYLSELETLPCCTLLTRSNRLELPEDAEYIVDLVLLEAGPMIAQSGKSLGELIQALRPYPVPGRRPVPGLKVQGENLQIFASAIGLEIDPGNQPLTGQHGQTIIAVRPSSCRLEDLQDLVEPE